MSAEVWFWLLSVFVVYTYLGYPLLLAMAASLRGRIDLPEVATCPPRSVSLILAVYNEERDIARRLREFTDLLGSASVVAELIVVSDGSTDKTAAIARTFTNGVVRLIDLPANGGKAAALTHGYRAARNEILVFADVRQSWAPDALRLLLQRFSDPEVGAVSGDLVIESRPGIMAGVNLYWKHEKWLRRQESRLHSTIGVTGAISAVRRELFRPIPPGTILDDVFWPLQVTLQGFRVVHESRARAFDRLPDRVRDEFRRKVRTLSGNFQLIMRSPTLLLPWRNPIWIQFLSHKVFRLLVPWALFGLLLLSGVLPGAIYVAAFWAQVLFYFVGVAGIDQRVGGRLRVVTAAGAFVVLNAAAWLAWWTWASGWSTRSWVKARYSSG